MDIQQIVDTELVRRLVSRDIQCRMTGKVLDVRTCLVIRNANGDPLAVLDPSVAGDESLKRRITDKGWTLDTRNVKR